MRILIIRHGDPDYSIDSVTSRGKIEVAALADFIRKENVKKAYISPLGRAQDTALPCLKDSGIPYETRDFLKEFGYTIDVPGMGKQGIPWDLLPEFCADNPKLFNNDEWYNVDFLKKTNIKAAYNDVCNSFDQLLCEHGYKKNGYCCYDAIKPNNDTIALFCHFGVEAVLLSYLSKCSPYTLWQNFVALPTSVTTLYSEERRKGKAIFRCCAFGERTHLYINNIKPSPAGRFCELYNEDERLVDPDYQVSVEDRVKNNG